MKVTHAELFRHIKARGGNFGVMYEIEDACNRDLLQAEMTYARAVYLEKYAAYNDFYANY